MLEAKNIDFSYQNRRILKNLSFSIKKGEIASLVGASGTGKTTLFRLITGLLLPDSGSLFINGIKNHFSEVTYLQQEDLLLPWRTILENLLIIYELGKKTHSHKDLKSKALELLFKVGLKGFENCYPHELSGGMRQRASLARALLQKRPVLLLDEPFGSLDVIIREELYALIKEIVLEEKITLLFVTHDFRDAFSLSDRILVLNDMHIRNSISLTTDIKNNPHQVENLFQQIRQQLR